LTPATRLGVAEAASEIAKARLSATVLIDRLLERIEAIDPTLNSYITVMADSAREAAREADVAARAGKPLGPLHGVPIALKDLYATKGVRTTFACAAFADWTPDYDATVVTRLKRAGAIILGKQNMHEAAAGSSSLVSHFGPVRNPWSVEHIAGGSSGGSAAALAAGLAAGALGSDTAMSIRQPAAYCGVVGLKPTFGRVSKHGALTLSWSLDHAGPMTRSSRDAALLLQAIAGFDPQDPSSAHIEVLDYLSALTGDLTGLRIGAPRRHFFEQCSPAVIAAVELAIETLRRLGATVSDCELPDPEDTLMFGRAILRIEASAYHAERLKRAALNSAPFSICRLSAFAAFSLRSSRAPWSRSTPSSRLLRRARRSASSKTSRLGRAHACATPCRSISLAFQPSRSHAASTRRAFRSAYRSSAIRSTQRPLYGSQMHTNVSLNGHAAVLH